MRIGCIDLHVRQKVERWSAYLPLGHVVQLCVDVGAWVPDGHASHWNGVSEPFMEYWNPTLDDPSNEFVEKPCLQVRHLSTVPLGENVPAADIDKKILASKSRLTYLEDMLHTCPQLMQGIRRPHISHTWFDWVCFDALLDTINAQPGGGIAVKLPLAHGLHVEMLLWYSAVWVPRELNLPTGQSVHLEAPDLDAYLSQCCTKHIPIRHHIPATVTHITLS